MQVGDRVKKLREARKITQSRVADAIGVRQSTISEIERGTNFPSMQVLVKLASFFDVRPGHFLDETDAADDSAEEQVVESVAQ